MKQRNIFLVGLSVLLPVACSKQMEYKEYIVYDRDYITSTFANVGGFMTDIYNTMEYDYGNYLSGAMLASASDESEYSVIGNPIETFYNGGWSPSKPISGTWTNMYKGISTCNIVLSEMMGLNFEELELNKDYMQQKYRYDNYRHEARFMRAFFYFCLVRQYGGVPLVKEGMTHEEINQMTRNSSDEVFGFIISECDDIQNKIIRDYTDLGDYALGTAEDGRADQLAVLALKARAALYWASPLFNPGNDRERWYNAALYNKELFDACAARGKALTDNYKDLWSTLNYTTAAIAKEIIFARRISGVNNYAESYNYPAGIEKAASTTDVDGIVGANCPTQNLVDAYDMLNGKSIFEPGSGYDESDPYANRDPRLAQTVAYNGMRWPEYSGARNLQTYVGGANGIPLAGATTTGYYLKKLLHGEIDLGANSKLKQNYHTYVLFRLGGICLDYAEAVFQYLGNADATSSEFPVSARELAGMTRVRAGMPPFEPGMSDAAFWTKYKRERMVELSFEGHRFWDVRRWKEAEKYFTNIVRMQITREGDNCTYTRMDVLRQWDEKMYLFPIPQTELMKNGKLEQNPGWR
ncbi:MAG: RagB/SusD family nutrient uptake outer membrane protein [Bacteroidales bacterium]|nr:RagB/SusD family nutrient uptake outer membrane protein [Bacteroidales bacterium]